MIAASLALVVLGRTALVTMPIVVAVIAALWVAFAGYPFLAGHLPSLLEDIGNPGGAAGSGVVGRVRGNPGHTAVVLERILYSLAFWGIAAVGLWRRGRAGHRDVAAAGLAAVPFGLVGVATYGGEIFLRVFLLSLPAMAFLAAAAFPWRPQVGRLRSGALLVLVSAVLGAGFLVGRYGNERADYLTSDELVAVNRAIETVGDEGIVAVLNFNTPIRVRAFETTSIVDLSGTPGLPTATQIAARLETLDQTRPIYLWVTSGQIALDELLGATPADATALRADLGSSARFRVQFQTPETTLYRWIPAEASR